eukprot:CAMPEP_0198313004 /NCGR_PEP_ID=MMETSP1450-20131203/4168_1 /TAXON_ID=753684 ORGANISM="Madagascaria erythrocladiodes, Strain CCMP3234" /NCGR_SAMPLE_ID=MMETSP1450 /ASSEMBLY_ACC=CAM_ASM_001115 /LENGTH=95 /DNA_ID=CAMNT_0044015973 /DNA_START=304 /DNA_END=591 /DNA_ORIENTATION=+
MRYVCLTVFWDNAAGRVLYARRETEAEMPPELRLREDEEPVAECCEVLWGVSSARRTRRPGECVSGGRGRVVHGKTPPSVRPGELLKFGRLREAR